MIFLWFGLIRLGSWPGRFQCRRFRFYFRYRWFQFLEVQAPLPDLGVGLGLKGLLGPGPGWFLWAQALLVFSHGTFGPQGPGLQGPKARLSVHVLASGGGGMRSREVTLREGTVDFPRPRTASACPRCVNAERHSARPQPQHRRLQGTDCVSSSGASPVDPYRYRQI